MDDNKEYYEFLVDYFINHIQQTDHIPETSDIRNKR